MQQGLSCIPLKLLTVYFMVRTTGLFYLMALANWPWETKNSRHHEQVNGWINNFISVCCVTLLINRWGCHVILCMLYLLLIMLMHFASSTKEVEASFCHLELLAGVWIQTLPHPSPSPIRGEIHTTDLRTWLTGHLSAGWPDTAWGSYHLLLRPATQPSVLASAVAWTQVLFTVKGLAFFHGLAVRSTSSIIKWLGKGCLYTMTVPYQFKD